MALRPRTIHHQNYGHRVEVPPLTEPVTLADVKEHLRITDSDSDSYIQALITSARITLEEYTGLAFITQQWKLTLDRWPSGRDYWWSGVRQGSLRELEGMYSDLTLPRYPLQSIVSVKTFNQTSDETIVSVGDVFDLDTNSVRGRLTLKAGQVWPIALRESNAIEVIYSAGYGDSTDDVPGPLKQAVMQATAYMYDNRGNCGSANVWANSGAAIHLRAFSDTTV